MSCVVFEATSHVRAGEELFISCGDASVPGGEHFAQADELFLDFMQTVRLHRRQQTQQQEGEVGEGEDDTMGGMNDSDDLVNHRDEYEKVLGEASEKDRR